MSIGNQEITNNKQENTNEKEKHLHYFLLETLVRNNIPKMLKVNHKILDIDSYKKALPNKVKDLSEDIINSANKNYNQEELISRLADLISIINEIKIHYEIGDEKLNECIIDRDNKFGDFKERTYVTTLCVKGYIGDKSNNILNYYLSRFKLIKIEKDDNKKTSIGIY